MGIREVLRTATADNRITADEWKTRIKPHADFSVKEASDDARAVLEAFSCSQFEVEPAVRAEMASYLASRGYDAPATRPEGLTDAAFFEQVKRTNISETDEAFAELVERAGKAEATSTIAVLDAGFDTAHDALDSKLWTNEGEIEGDGIDNDQNGKIDDLHGWDFVDGDNDPDGTQSNGHGSHLTGLATQGTDQVKSISVRTYSPLDPQKVSEAIDYAVSNGARVLNLSFKVATPQLVDAIGAAMARHPDVLFVKSAGNDGRDLDGYNGDAYLSKNALENMAVVSAGNQDGSPAAYSNHGKAWATHGAVGSDVLSAVPGDGFFKMSGTSMAAPQLTGLAGKMLLLDPALKPAELKGMISDTSDRREDWGSFTQSGGLMNAQRAYTLAALTGLIRSGLTPEAAAEQVGLEGAQVAALAKLAAKYVTAATGPKAV